MGKKKRSHPDVEELLARPWCYYCERDFEDLKLLISHQKAKHFKCERCGRRLNTAGGLSVHMNQVHKETLAQVENALANRQGLDVEIFGMEGVPEEVLQQHKQRIIQNYYQAQAERRAATGNPPPGQSGGQGPAKKIKYESPEELKKRLADFRAQAAARKAAQANGSSGNTPLRDGQSASPGAFNSPFPPPQQAFDFTLPYNAPPAGVPGGAQFPPQQYPVAGYPASTLPTRPPSNAPMTSNLPQRPPYGGNYPPGAYPGPPGAAAPGATTLEDLVSGAARQAGDDIDRVIRMAEAGIKPGAKEGAGEHHAEKPKKEKTMRMIYADTDYSLEEKMAQMSRYALVPEV